MKLLSALAKTAQAAALGVVVVKAAENAGKVVAAVDRGAARVVRAGNAKLARVVERVREAKR